MPTKTTPKQALDDISSILEVWSENPELVLKDEVEPGNATKQITLEDVVNLRDALEELLKQISSLESKLGGMTDKRDDTAKMLNGIRTRALSLFRGVFGPNSSQYDRAGGTRQSEHKPRTRTAKAKGNLPG